MVLRWGGIAPSHHEVSVVYSLDVGPTCVGYIRLKLIRPHHLIVLVVGDVAVPDIVSVRGTGIEGKAACISRQYVLRSETHDKARHLSRRHDGSVFPSSLIG